MTMLPLKQQHGGELRTEAFLEIAREQLGGDRRPHVVGHEHHRLLHPVLGERLDDVRLVEQRVHVIAWLLREPEAEEVEADYPPVGEQLAHVAPVVAARGESVQEQHRRDPLPAARG